MKTVLIVVNVEGKCLLISVPFASILLVLTRIRTTAINVEFAGGLNITFFVSKIMITRIVDTTAAPALYIVGQ